MGLLRKAAQLHRRLFARTAPSHDPHVSADGLRICRFEELENRNLLSADINFGAFYYEDDLGADQSGDRFEISFNGGPPGTQLTRVVINTDKDDQGLSLGDAFFDTAPGGKGTSNSFGFSIVDQTGITQVNASVVDGGTLLVLNLVGFDPGEKLVFTIDVDEQGFQPASASAVVEGAEFEGSQILATFQAPHFFDANIDVRYFDVFDYSTLNLNLPPDNWQPPGAPDARPVHTAGCAGTITPQPLPSSIAGTVFEDFNQNNTQDGGDAGINDVTLTLLVQSGNAYVPTGKTAVTSGAGQYIFQDVLPGNYRVVESQPGGYFSVGAKAGNINGTPVGTVTSVDVISEIVLLGGQDSVQNNYAESLPAQLAGHVYHDADNNGLLNGEQGIPGVRVVVERLPSSVPAQGPQVVEVFSDANGAWLAVGLQPGNYVVRETQPAGYFDGLDKAGNAGGEAQNPGDLIGGVFLASRQIGVNYDFGELLPISISGLVHTDHNFDCILGAGETALSGVTVFLLDAAGNRIDSRVTGADGRYEFAGLHPGTYGIEEVQPAGLFNGGQVTGSHGAATSGGDIFTGITVGSGQNAVNYNFCEHPPASIAGTVYVDDNQNGLLDAGEAGITGVTLQLLDKNGNPTGATMTTGGDGSYIFTGLPPEVYGVAELQPAGFFDGLDAAGTAGGAAQNPGDHITGAVLAPNVHGVSYNFGELRPVSLSGLVHTDIDFDCLLDPGEQTLSGVTVFLLDAAGNRIDSRVTGADGRYEFAGLHPGTYGIEEVQPTGLFNGGQVTGSHGAATSGGDKFTGIVLTSGQNGVNYIFCEHPPASIAGTVYVDDNNNGVLNAGEAGIAGVTLQLLDKNGNPTGRTTTTAADGSYIFDNLPPEQYGVAELQPAGFFDGLDAAGNAGGTALNPGDQITGAVLFPTLNAAGYNFGELRPVSLRGLVHADVDQDCILDPGETPLSGVTVFLIDAAGNRIGSTTTNAAGEYEFVGLFPGVYGVEEQQPAGFFQGGQTVGSHGGAVAATDRITGIVLASGQNAVNYNFCEHPPVGLRGTVYADDNNNGQIDAGEEGIVGVVLQLLDANGNPTGTTTTSGADGSYAFTPLPPGVYGVAEQQPAGFIDGIDSVGTAGGVVQNPGDRITGAVLPPGAKGFDYNFGEVRPARISGRVHTDTDLDCLLDAGETPLAGVTIYLLDGNGNRIASTTTDADGFYSFDDLYPGVYGIEEIQPAGFFQGGQPIGTHGGTAANDKFTGVAIVGGDNAAEYNFCEHPPAEFSGRVYVDENNNGQPDSGEPGIVGVTLQLLDANMNPTGRTVTTAADGSYRFNNLPPETYGVMELQPAGFFDGRDTAGTAGGVALNPGDKISGIPLLPGTIATGYLFGELRPAEISGFVFRDGQPIEMPAEGELDEFDIGEVSNGQRTPDDTPLAGVTLRLADSEGNSILDANGQPVTTTTDATGFYRFRDLPPGTYSVFQTQPEGLIDGLDTPGSTGGFAANPNDDLNPAFFSLTADHNNDAIILVSVGPGGSSTENNFSELLEAPPPPPPPPPMPPIFFNPPREFPVPPPRVAPTFGSGASPAGPGFSPPPPATVLATSYFGATPDGPTDFSWHLSIIDGGYPRGRVQADGTLLPVAETRLDVFAVDPRQMRESRWELQLADGTLRENFFGMAEGIPVTGDWDGDGVTEIGVYHLGQWFLDLNGNGVWDEGDLWAELGGELDFPVTGDWDGDGKTDIGIFGPAWPNDPRAVAAEPGLPDPENRPTGEYKNVPPEPGDAPTDTRKLKRTSRGPTRADVIDHVFYFGDERDLPVTGDWNADGVDTIGVFQGGNWILDDNGDGHWLPGETMFEMGQPGDIPVVGDFNGDGVDELGVYRNGAWLIDTNGDRRLDALDQVYHLGGAGERPIVGDWDGDGNEDPGVYHPAAREIRTLP